MKEGRNKFISIVFSAKEYKYMMEMFTFNEPSFYKTSAISTILGFR